METQTYTIVALLGRYILIAFCFLVFIFTILEIRKEQQVNKSTNLATLEWKRKRVSFDLSAKNIIGRRNNCDIVIKSPFVKARHFALYLDCEEWIVAPYKNREVHINNFLVEEPVQIEDGDKLSFGHENMVFHLTNDEDLNTDA